MSGQVWAAIAASAGVLGALAGSVVTALLDQRADGRRRDHELRLRELDRAVAQESLQRQERREVYLRYLSAVSKLRRSIFALRRAIDEPSWWQGEAEHAAGARGHAFQLTFAALHDYYEIAEDVKLVASEAVHDAIQGRMTRWPRPGNDQRANPGRTQLFAYAQDLNAAAQDVQRAMRQDLGYRETPDGSPDALPLAAKTRVQPRRG